MTGKQGQPTPPYVIDFISEAVTEDSTRTNAVIKALLTEKFEWSPTISTINRHRNALGLPSSRTAIKSAAARRSSQLTKLLRDQVRMLMEKFHLPFPDSLLLTPLVLDVGEGKIGPSGERIYIRLVDNELVDCWLTEDEFSSVVKSLEKVPDLQMEFLAIHDHGIRIIDNILKHNQGIENGTGDISFAWLRELLKSKKTADFAFFETDAKQLWDRYIAFGTELGNFTRKF